MPNRRGCGTVVCQGCGGAVPVDAAACAYCGGAVVFPKPVGSDGPAERRTYCTRCAALYPAQAARCPRCPPASGEDRGGHCPRCAGDLVPEAMGTVTVDRCKGCRGLWFDGNEIEHVINATTEGVSRHDADRTRRVLPARSQPSEVVRYLACVRCGERMVRRQAAPRAGVVVDVCGPHGVWFDADEFQHFAAWCAAGGLEVLRHDGVAAAEGRRRRRDPDRAFAPNASLPPVSGDDDVLVWGLGAFLRGLGRILGSGRPW